MYFGERKERQRVDAYLHHSRAERMLALLCECILWSLILLTGFVEGLFGWLHYIPDERKMRIKKHILSWLQYAECEVKKIKAHLHRFFHMDSTPL